MKGELWKSLSDELSAAAETLDTDADGLTAFECTMATSKLHGLASIACLIGYAMDNGDWATVDKHTERFYERYKRAGEMVIGIVQAAKMLQYDAQA